MSENALHFTVPRATTPPPYTLTFRKQDSQSSTRPCHRRVSPDAMTMFNIPEAGILRSPTRGFILLLRNVWYTASVHITAENHTPES